MPKWLENLQIDFLSSGEQVFADFFSSPTGGLLDSSLLYTKSLAFRKAYRARLEKEEKHFDAQYQLYLIMFAFEYWEQHGIEKDDLIDGGDFSPQGCLMYAIMEALDSFSCYFFDKTLTEEEYKAFLSLQKSFYSKYVSPKELKEYQISLEREGC